MGNVPPSSPGASGSSRPHHQSSMNLYNGYTAANPPSYQSDVVTSKDLAARKYHSTHHHGHHHHHQGHNHHYHHNQPREFTLPEPSLIIPPYLYLGGSHLNKNPHLSDYLGITHIINMAMELRPHEDLHMSPRIKYLHIRADDSLSYNIRHHFEEAFEIIDDARRTNGKVLVHCVMGISRSATIVIAYLMSRYNYSLNTAYSLVKSRRPEINPNPLFMRILQQYEQELAVKDQQRQQNSVDFNRYVKATPHAAVDHRPISTYYPSHDPYGQYTSRSFYG